MRPRASPRLRRPRRAGARSRGRSARESRAQAARPPARPRPQAPGSTRSRARWRRRARLEHALELVVERGEADEHRDEAPRGEVREQVEVAQHQRALGDDGDRVAVREQHLEQLRASMRCSRSAGWYGIGVGAEIDRLADVAGCASSRSSSRASPGLWNMPRLEIEPGAAGSSRSGKAARSSRCSRARSPGTD